MQRRHLLLTPLAAALLLAGCAALNQLTSEVATYGEWPAGRKAGSYAFERLPSQQAKAQQQADLEAAAAKAMEQAGFTVAKDPATADVIVPTYLKRFRPLQQTKRIRTPARNGA